jgi:DNA-binding transcriptional MerR regulator
VLTIEEAAKLFKVSKPTIYRWIAQDEISYRIINDIKHFDIDQLQNAYQIRHSLSKS